MTTPDVDARPIKGLHSVTEPLGSAESLLAEWFAWWRDTDELPVKLPDALHVRTALFLEAEPESHAAEAGLTSVEPFGFTVEQDRDYQDPEYRAAWNAAREVGLPHPQPRPEAPLIDEWKVYLPHQCDNWSITPEYADASHAEAVAHLACFIAEATSALEALRNRKEIGRDDDLR